MLLQDPDSGEHLTAIGIGLTEAEVGELRDRLEALLADPDPSRHEHVASADFQTELTVWIDPADS